MAEYYHDRLIMHFYSYTTGMWIMCFFVITASFNQYSPGCLLSAWCNWWSAGRYLPEYKVSWGSGAWITWCSR